MPSSSVTPGGGSSGGGTLLYNQTLSVPAASIDPGANSIPAGYAVIEFYFQGASDSVTGVTLAGTGLQINGDTGANYYWESVADVGANAGTGGAGQYGGSALSKNASAGDAGAIRMNLPGASAGAGSSYLAHGRIFNYDNTTWKKVLIISHGLYDPTTSVNARSRSALGYWDNTAAITQIAMVSTGHNLVAGSRLTIYGR
jgi:hypothetical protein